MRHLYGPVVFLWASIALPVAALAQATDPKVIRYGEHLSQECTTCHRRDGVDNGIPSIIGMKADEFTETFKYYQTGARTNAAMVSVAQSLDDQQIKALAAFYASLPPPPKKK
jgi:cytochrome c